MLNNIILNTDSYKASHYLQYPPGTTHVSMYIESRGGRYDSTVFFGLQALLKSYLAKPITQADIDEAAELITSHGLPFNRAGWQFILDEHNGYLPLEIQALPEGTDVPVHNVLVQITNTCPKCYWLPGYIETMLLRGVWYPTTVATYSKRCKQVIAKWMQQTTGSIEGLQFKLHDFGARGVSSAESAAIGGLAHLVNFSGTDTLGAIKLARDAYMEPMAGFSIPAAEHSTMTAWGRDNELGAYQNMIEVNRDAPLIAVVSDSYDIYSAINAWGTSLKPQVEGFGGTVVIRLDSGCPDEMVLGAIECLMMHYGSTTNDMGYRVLPDCIRVIQGDGICIQMIDKILSKLEQARISADNVTFGMGGELLQKHNRDTQRFAMKASAIRIHSGPWQGISKNPVSDPSKRSKEGRLAFDGAKTVQEHECTNNHLRIVYKDGHIVREDSLATIRERANDNVHILATEEANTA